MLVQSAAAQYMQEWAKQLGGDKEDRAKSAIYDSDGRIVIAGKVIKRRTRTWIAVTDGNGKDIWGKTFKDAFASGAEQIIETSDGKYLVAGFIRKKRRNRNLNGYLMKTDKQGNVLWQKRYGGDEDDVLLDVCETDDQGFLAVGYSESNPDKEKEMWVLKTDRFGNKESEKFYWDNDADIANTVLAASDGNYIVAGYSISDGMRNARILKVGADCEMIWDLPTAFGKFQEIHDLAELPDSTLLAAGTARYGHITDYDAYLLKFSHFGDTIKSFTYGYGRWEEASTVKISFDENILLGGFEKSESYSYSDFWLRKVDYHGSEIFHDIYRRKTIDFPHALLETSDNGVVLVGSTWHIEHGWDYAVLKYKDINKTDVEFHLPQKPEAGSPGKHTRIKACVTSFDEPENVDIVVNGIVQIPDAYDPLFISEEKCLYPINAELRLSPGENQVMIAVKDKRGNIVTEERTIYYIPPADMSW